MVFPTFGAYMWDVALGVSFVAGAMIALPAKKVGVRKVIVLMLICSIILCVLDVVQKQTPEDLQIYMFLFITAGIMEISAIILATHYTVGSIYKRAVVNMFITICSSALLFAVCYLFEPARKVMAAETISRSSEGIGYLVIVIAQLFVAAVGGLIARLILKHFSGDGIVYRILFVLLMLYDIVGVPARGYVNYKAKFKTPDQDHVLRVLGVSYISMSVTIAAAAVITVNILKSREKQKAKERIEEKSLIEDKILNEIKQEQGESSDEIQELLQNMSDEASKRGMVLEVLSDMKDVSRRYKPAAGTLKKELDSVNRIFHGMKGSGGYMTLCVRPVADRMMLMCEIEFRECADGDKRKLITRVL